MMHLHVQSRERFRTYYRYSRQSEGVGSFLRGASTRMDRDKGRGLIVIHGRIWGQGMGAKVLTHLCPHFSGR